MDAVPRVGRRQPAEVGVGERERGDGDYGVGFGWLLNLHTTGFNFFVGTDHTMGKLSKQFVPLNSNADLNIGINFPF